MSSKSPIFPPLQPDNTGRSGKVLLLCIGDTRLGEPVATNHQLAVLPYHPKLLTKLTKFLPSVTVVTHGRRCWSVNCNGVSVLNPNEAIGSLGFSDLDNQASFKTSTSSMGLSSGGFTGSQDFISNMGGGIPIMGGNSGDASSTTHAAISDGTITVRDTDKQQQNVADLSRDVEHANNALTPIFDKEKEQNRLREINLIGEIGNQVADIARTQGKIAEEKALKDPKAIQAAKDALAENGNLTPTNKQVTDQVRSTASASYGTGSDLQRAIQAATAITQGLTGGNMGQALAGGSAPYLANEISKYLPAEQSLGANLMAHAVLGAVVGHFSGNATVGAVSAFTAEAAAPAIIKAMGWDKDSLTEKQKQTVSALATLAAGLAGGLVGDSSSSAVAGAQAGKNAVENNYLSATQIDDFAARAKGCEARSDCKQIVKEMEDLSLKQHQELIAVCSTNPVACKEKYGDIPANGMLVREAIDRVLGDDVPSKMKNDMSSLLAQQVEAEGVVSSTDFAQRLQNIYGIDKQQAELLAVAALGAVTGGMSKSGKPVSGAEGKNIVVVDSGKKGAWNKAMNKPEPNTVYQVDGNKTFQTDAQNRTSLAEGTLSWSKNDRNTYQQCKAGKCGSTGDEGGHLIASIFNGPGEKLNLVPMDGNLNKSGWKQMENTWANALKDGKQVNVKIEPVYSGNNKRPDSFSVTYSIDGGRPVIKDISNTPGGVK